MSDKKLTREEIIARRSRIEAVISEAPHIIITGPRGDDGQPEDADAATNIEINSITGTVVSDLDALPEWAEGLGVAVVSERSQYYRAAVGYVPVVGDERGIEIINVADLEWVAKFEGEDESIVPADHEYRMAQVSSLVYDLDAWEKDPTGEIAFKAQTGFDHTKAATLELDPEMVPDDALSLADEEITEAVAELASATASDVVFGKAIKAGH